jgi:hypothetical protein
MTSEKDVCQSPQEQEIVASFPRLALFKHQQQHAFSLQTGWPVVHAWSPVDHPGLASPSQSGSYKKAHHLSF